MIGIDILVFLLHISTAVKIFEFHLNLILTWNILDFIIQHQYN